MNEILHKILYVEDEPDIAAIAKIALEDLGGFELCYCSSGKEALAQAPVFQPDLFLIDVMMPEMDGITLLHEVKRLPQFAETPVVFMTAKTQSHEVKEYLKLGAIDVITKPFDPIELAQKIKSIWNSYNERISP